MFTFSNIFPCTVSCSYEIYETILLKFRDCVHSIWYCKCCCVCKITAGFSFWGLKEDDRLQKKAIQHISLWWHYVSQHQTLETIFRNGVTVQRPRQHLIWSDAEITLLAFWTSFTQRRKTKLHSVNWLFWILLNCLMMLWTYLLFTYFSMCEWVCLSTQDQFSVCLFLCLCVLSLVVWKVFVLHVCNYSCGDVHLLLHLPVPIIWWTSSQQRAKV